MTRKIQVFIADDHTVLRSGLRMMLNAEADMIVVGEAADVTQASEGIRQYQPDVVLLDVSMPGVNGLDGLPLLRQSSPRSRFLILTMHNDEQYLRRALSQGASGYVLKQAANEDLLNAIRVVDHEGTYLHANHRELLFEKTSAEPAPAHAGDVDSAQRLSPREQEILELIVMGYTNRQAAEKLILSEKTIETYKSRLMTKLGLNTRVELVRYALQHGLIKSE